jgi:hypothetical protein
MSKFRISIESRLFLVPLPSLPNPLPNLQPSFTRRTRGHCLETFIVENSYFTPLNVVSLTTLSCWLNHPRLINSFFRNLLEHNRDRAGVPQSQLSLTPARSCTCRTSSICLIAGGTLPSALISSNRGSRRADSFSSTQSRNATSVACLMEVLWFWNTRWLTARFRVMRQVFRIPVHTQAT